MMYNIMCDINILPHGPEEHLSHHSFNATTLLMIFTEDQ